MEKNCRRNLKKEGINQTRFMWMFIKIFGSNHKRLLMENKHKSKNITVNEKKQLSCSCESSKEEMLKKKDFDFSISSDEDLVESEVYKNLADESEENFSEIIKRLIAYKEAEIQTCKDLLEAFDVLGSKEESQRFGDSKREEEEKTEIDSKQEVKKGKLFSRKWRRDVSSSSRPYSNGNKPKIGRTFSRFFIGLIKGRLQSTIGKNSCDVQEDIDVQESEDSKKMMMSSLYIVAKKHLSEMLASGDIDMSLSDKEVPRILGKILSLPEFSSPVESPRLILDHDLVSHFSPLSPRTEQLSSETNDLINEGENTNVKDSNLLSEVFESSSSKQDECVEEEEEEDQSLRKEMFNQTNSLTSPPESPTSSSIRTMESKETVTDLQGKLSPVSVLEPLFTDDDNSPISNTRFSSAMDLCIRFNEDESPQPNNNNNVKTSIDEKESTLAYIEAIVNSSSLNWEELLMKTFNSEQLLEPIDDIAFYSTQLCDDKNLLYDCINEVLMELCVNEFKKPEVHLISNMEIVAKVVQERVYWHLLPLPSPHTLDQIVKKDMARAGSWMDLRFEIGCIGCFTGDMILDELVEEITRCCRDIVQAEQM